MDKRDDYQLLKSRLHGEILNRLRLEKLGKTSGDSARDQVLVVIRSAVNAEVVPLSFAERERLAREILDELFGLPTRHEARRKEFWLTTRKVEIVSAVVAGYSNREIAEYFKISEDTVEQHLNNIFEQLGVATRLESLRYDRIYTSRLRLPLNFASLVLCEQDNQRIGQKLLEQRCCIESGHYWHSKV